MRESYNNGLGTLVVDLKELNLAATKLVSKKIMHVISRTYKMRVELAGILPAALHRKNNVRINSVNRYYSVCEWSPGYHVYSHTCHRIRNPWK
jgi:hypothetical protein